MWIERNNEPYTKIKNNAFKNRKPNVENVKTRYNLFWSRVNSAVGQKRRCKKAIYEKEFQQKLQNSKQFIFMADVFSLVYLAVPIILNI